MVHKKFKKKIIRISDSYGSYELTIRMNHWSKWHKSKYNFKNQFKHFLKFKKKSYGLVIRMVHTDSQSVWTDPYGSSDNYFLKKIVTSQYLNIF